MRSRSDASDPWPRKTVQAYVRAHRLRPYAVTAARTVDNPELTAEVTV